MLIKKSMRRERMMRDMLKGVESRRKTCFLLFTSILVFAMLIPALLQPVSARVQLAMVKSADVVDKRRQEWSFDNKQGSSIGSSECEFFLEDTLDINIVFVGFDNARIDTGLLESLLPETYTPINRYPTFYDPENPEYLGIEFTLEYHFVFASERFTENLFDYINSIGTLASPTLFQGIDPSWGYSAQPGALLTITENLWVPADPVEMWLEKNMKRIGHLEGYTIFFLDGYTNGYLPFHTYYFDEPDFDTGHNFGFMDSRQSIAFGGKYDRVWFYDASAGPEYWSYNMWPELYWNPEAQAKPPIWHYEVLVDPVTRLSIDLAEVARFIAINLMFTSSSLYRPLLATKIHINVVMFENATDVGYWGQDYFDPEIVEQVYEDFEPHKEWKVTFSDRNLMDYPVLNEIFANWAQGEYSLYMPLFPYAEIDFYIYYYMVSGLDPFLDEEASEWADYSIPVFAYAVKDDQMGVQFGLLGYADDDWTTGTQTFINAFNTPYITTSLGYGFTSTIIHETGHHVGLSHPHDGYDSEFDLDYGPGGYFLFVWSGDGSYTTMNYMANVGHFGVFNKDTLYRHEGAMYMKAVKDMMEEIVWEELSPQDYRKLANVLVHWGQAMLAFKKMEYYCMVYRAMQSYEQMLEIVND